jgi:thioesterase domain-containing protein
MLSGDWIPLPLPDAVRRVFRRARVMSLGGATEAAIWSNHFSLGEIDPRWASIPYGRPIQNCRYHVLDARLAPVSVGVAGDLYIGGVCLAQGYLNRPELTAERFIPDPFSQEPGARLYKTGDLARYFEDGELEFLGRSDFQVKIRGYRVELPEIEQALLGIRDVHEAVCNAYTDASGQRSIAAYVVQAPRATLDEDTVKRELRERLPEFMVPAVVLFLDALPLSSNRKLDRKALPSPLQRNTQRAFVAARTELEAKLVEIWERVLDRRPIGVRDDFFKLGGHSMLAVMLTSQLKQHLGVRVPLSNIIEHPTIECFAAHLSSAAPRCEASLLVELRDGGPKNLFFVHDGDGETLLYHRLAQHVPAEYAVYGIKPPSRDAIPVAQTCMRALAACYVAEVRRRQPQGPYCFAGLCAGAVIAFEMARQLHEAGEVTDLLFMLDAAVPTARRRPLLEPKRKLKRFYRRLRSQLFPAHTTCSAVAAVRAQHPAAPPARSPITTLLGSCRSMLSKRVWRALIRAERARSRAQRETALRAHGEAARHGRSVAERSASIDCASDL